MASWEFHGGRSVAAQAERPRHPLAGRAFAAGRVVVALLLYGFLAALVSLFSGCGGGSSGAPVQTPPPLPDFSLGFSSSSVAVVQGATSPPVTLTVVASNNFSGAVQVTLSGLPQGVTSNPATPFSINAGSTATMLFGAAASAPAGSFTVSAQASSGNLSHTAAISLSVQNGVVSTLPRTAYRRTDAVASLDDPPGEPHHRHLVYDSANKHVFVANRALNRVDVLSSIDGGGVASISVPGASSADLSLDGKTVWVGTVTNLAAAVDTASLQVRSSTAIPSVQPLPNTTFDRPEEILAFSNGKLAVRVRQAAGPQALLAIWDPSSNSLTNLTATTPGLFQNGVGVIARTANHSRLFAAANDSSGEVALFDGNGAVMAGPVTLGSGTIPLAAANGDGSRFAAAFSSGGATQIKLLDGGLNVLNSYAAVNPAGLVFSPDAQQLYVAENISGAPVLTVLGGSDFHLIGRVADAAIQGMRSEIEEADETGMVFGLVNRGLSLIDAAHPGTLPSTAPLFAAAPVAQPSEGPSMGGTATVLSGQNFEPTAQVKVGTQAAASVQVSGGGQMQLTTPPNAMSGAVNVTAYFPSGWLAVAPDAFSYGPQIREILPNTGSKTGGDPISIYGYGFGSDPAKILVKIGPATAPVQSVEIVPVFASSAAFDPSYPFPLERLTVQTPPGTPGAADVSVNSPAGAAASARGFQYLQDVQLHAKAGFYKFLLYDRTRQWLYLSNIDHVDVFDLATALFRPPIQPPGGPPPNAQLRGLALTPDGSLLAIADFGAQSVYLMDPDSGTGSATFVGGIAGFTNSGPARVAATGAQTLFVSLAAEGATGGCSTCLAQMDISASPPTAQVAPQPQVSTLAGSALLQASADGSHVFFSFAKAPGGPLAVWDASSPGQFSTTLANTGATDLAVAADATQFVLTQRGSAEIRDSAFRLTAAPSAPELERVPLRTEVPGIAVHPTGALVYRPFLIGAPPASLPITGVQSGVDIDDARTGQLRLRVLLPEPFAMLAADSDALHASFFAIDETGQRLFALTASGLTVVQLASVPLGIGSLTPAAAPASGGTTVTIHGSGFQAGTTLKIGGSPAAVTFKDMNTLTFVTPALAAGSQQIVLTNPGGETYSLDAAFLAQ